MKTISKLEIINALGENTSALALKKEELIDKLFDVQKACEGQIKLLKAYNLINIEDWGVSFLKRKCNDYMTYNGCIIDKYGGRFDGGDFNQWVPHTDYKMLLDFCNKADVIIKEMQDELTTKIREQEFIFGKIDE